MSEVFFCRSVCFQAAHHYHVSGWSDAENLTLFGDASRSHVHDWMLTIWLNGPIHPVTGMMVDLAQVDLVLQTEVILPFAGNSLKEVEPLFATQQPTTEVLAGYFAGRLQGKFGTATLRRLRIAEMSSLFAEWHA